MILMWNGIVNRRTSQLRAALRTVMFWVSFLSEKTREKENNEQNVPEILEVQIA